MIGKFKIIFADFLKTLRQLWLEFIGGIFVALGLLFILAAVKEYRLYVQSHVGSGRFLMVALSSLVMIFFGLESFWRSRKHR